MEKFKSKEEVQAVQVESIEGSWVNDSVYLDNATVSRQPIRVGDWLVFGADSNVRVMSNKQFQDEYGQADGVTAEVLRTVQAISIAKFRKIVPDEFDANQTVDIGLFS